MIQCIHTVASTRAAHGGTSRSVPALCNALSTKGTRVQLVTTVPVHNLKEQVPALPDSSVECQIFVEESGLRSRLRSPLAFQRVLTRVVDRQPPDIIHDHGAWLPSNRAASLAARSSGARLVISPRGMLSKWALQYKGLKKRAAWHLYQRRVLERADLLHATSEDEAADLRHLGLEQPIALIPNGVTLPRQYRTQVANIRLRRVLFLSRIHPKKGIANLLSAWANVSPIGWELILAGPNENGHQAELERIMSARGLGNEVIFSGRITDEQKWPLYRSADVFVLPTHSENFGIVVAEALASGIPVITTKGAPWQELETNRCGWWIDNSVENLSMALREALALSDEQRLDMGRRGRSLVEQHYSWHRIAASMHAAYGWLVGAGSMPSCVIRD